MKSKLLVFALLIFTIQFCFGQNKWPNDGDEIYQVLFEPDSRTNMVFYAYTNCPLSYTNLISNTNLFSPSEQVLLKEILSKYKNVTTNSGPAGTVLTGLEKTNGFYVARFSYTNFNAHEVITFGNMPPNTNYKPKFGGGYGMVVDEFTFFGTVAKFRINDDNGYDVMLNRPDANGVLTTACFAQIKQGKVNGLFVDFSNDSCQNLLRFVDGKAVGKWLQWDTYKDNHLLEVKIKSSWDYFKYMSREIKN